MSDGRGPMARRRARRARAPRTVLSTMLAVLVACCAASHAQTFYKWTDERGVVHLSDEPPLNARGVEQRALPPPPPAEPPAAETDEAKAAPAETPAETTSTNTAERDAQPARVVTVSRQVTRNGPHAAHIVGEVKNVGGQNADAVEITLRAVDASQGTLCLNEQAAVNPSTLPPGDSGTFDADIESPCLAGDTPVDIIPVWK
jgi:hypothetical protein